MKKNHIKQDRINKLVKSLTDVNQNICLIEVREERNNVAPDKVNAIARPLSMAYMMFSIANSYAEEAANEIEKLGLMHKKIKTRTVNLATAFDLFDKEYFAMIGSEEMKKEFCKEYDMLKRGLDEFMNKQE